jgi:hypothetical protein
MVIVILLKSSLSIEQVSQQSNDNTLNYPRAELVFKIDKVILLIDFELLKK